jgi:hypothetical protein
MTLVNLSGNRNGVNKIYTLSSPLTFGTEHLFFLNGQLQTYGDDYTIDDVTLTISDDMPPPTASDILILYGTIGNIISLETGFFGININGNGNTISPGVKGYLPIPYGGYFTGWKVVSSDTGSCEIDILRSETIPTSSDSITSEDYVVLNTQQINTKTGLPLWDSNFTSDDIIGWNVISSTVTNLTIILKLNKI